MEENRDNNLTEQTTEENVTETEAVKENAADTVIQPQENNVTADTEQPQAEGETAEAEQPQA